MNFKTVQTFIMSLKIVTYCSASGYIAIKIIKLVQLTQKYLLESILFSIFAAYLSNTGAKIFA